MAAESMVQYTDKRSEMQLDEIDLYLEKKLGYTVQIIQTPSISSWKIVKRDGTLVPVDAEHPTTYNVLRAWVGVEMKQRDRLIAQFKV